MPKLISEIITTIEYDFLSSYDIYSISASFDDIKNIRIIQNFNNVINMEEFEVKSFGIKKSFFNNSLIEINGDEF